MSEQHHLVTAKRLAPDGRGVASIDADSAVSGVEFLVQDLLPGESAWVEIEHKSPHKDRVWARIVKRASAVSSARTTPSCPAYGLCGGCSWQHLNHPGQLAEKCARVQAALDSTLAHPPKLQPPAPTETEQYRNKGKYVVARDNGSVVLGAYRPRSHEVVSTLGCRIVEAPIDACARRLANYATDLATPVYREASESSQGLRYVILRSNAEGEVLVLLVCSSSAPDRAIRELANRAFQDPEVVGVLRCDNDHTTGVLLTDAITPLIGSPTLAEYSSKAKIDLGAAAFWQLNRTQAAAAFSDLAKGLALPPGANIVELYCGVGAISFALAAEGFNVVGIENNSESIRAAKRAAASTTRDTTLEFVCADATQLESQVLANADAIVVDPPRKGLGKAGRDQLIAAKPQVIAYLSCGPESLATDLASLVDAGYSLEQISLYDFMPGTSQIETLAILRLPG